MTENQTEGDLRGRAPTAKRIAILLPDLGGGGAERINLELAREFVDMGYAVDFVLLQKRGELLDEVPRGAAVFGLDTAGAKWALRPLKAYLDEHRPDALLPSMWPVTWIAIVAARLTRKRPRVVVVEHIDVSAGFRGHPISRLAMRTLGRFVYRLPDAVVCVSEGVKRALVRESGVPADRVQVIYNPVRAPSSAAGVAHQDLLDWWRGSPHRLLSVGRLTRQKNHAMMIRAVASVCRHEDARLLVLGEGPERRSLQELVASLGLDEHVRLAGFHPNVQGYFAEASLFLLSSLWEGLPTVLIEALLQGVPIVSTDCPSGPAEILAGGRFGGLTAVDDTMAFAGATLEALRTPHDRERLIARGREFEPRTAAERYIRLLDPA